MSANIDNQDIQTIVGAISKQIDEKFDAQSKNLEKKFDEKFATQNIEIDTKLGLISEDLDKKFAVFTENLETIVIKLTKPIKEDVQHLMSDMKLVKAAVTATNQDVKLLDIRVSRLEAAT